MIDTHCVDLAALHRHLEASVLRHPTFGDVEFGHDLDAGDRLLGDFGARRVGDVREHAVDAVFHRQPARVGFEVDVGGAGFQRVVQRRAHQPHDRAGVLGDAGERQGLGAGILRHLRPAAAHAFHRAQAFLVAGQQRRQVGGMREAGLERCAQDVPGIRAARAVPGIGQQQPELVLGIVCDQAMPPGGFIEAQLAEVDRQRIQRSHVESGQTAVGRQQVQRGIDIEPELFLQAQHHGLAGGVRRLTQVGQRVGREGGVGRVHWIDPARSKIGM